MRVDLVSSAEFATFKAGLASNADSIWLDGAPHDIANILRAAGKRPDLRPLYVRLSGADASIEETLDALMAVAPAGFVMPVRRGVEVQRFGARLAVREAELGIEDGVTKILAVIAEPAAILDMPRIASASSRLAALAFDAAAFLAAVAGADTSAAPVALARGMSLLAAKAARLPSLLIGSDTDTATTISEGVRREGFDGAVVRHVATVGALRQKD